MIFKTMSPEAARKALEGQEDILTPAVREVEEYFKRLSCPACGSDCMKFVDGSKPFKEGALLPNYLARCKVCGVEFEPYTKIQISKPDLEP